jgi:hypothetical protein
MAEQAIHNPEKLATTIFLLVGAAALAFVSAVFVFVL